MRSRDPNLIDEIQQDALKSDVALADTLRKVIALGGQVGSTELRDWASRELHGYIGSDVELPEYRKPRAVIKVDAVKPGWQITGQQVSRLNLPEGIRDVIDEEVRLGEGIGEIEAMLESAKADGGVKLSLPDAQVIATLMDREIGEPYQHITSIYWAVSQSALQGVVDRVRTTLVELVAEMRAGTPETAELPSGEVANQAVSVAVYGSKARVNVTSPQVSSSGSHEVHTSGTEKRSGRPTFWVVLGSIAAVVAVLIALAQWQGWGV